MKRLLLPETEEPDYSDGIWTGGLEGEETVLPRLLTRPDGTEIVSRLTFSDISDHGFSSSGAVVTGAGTCENRTGLCIRRQQALQGWQPGGGGLKRVSR